ncbi:MAG: S-adenosylmethionine:tRNA ribosyltransferase-isomerase [Bacteroidales bacterium]
MRVKDISIEEFDYSLEEDRIAKYPLMERDKARLLYFDGNRIEDEIFSSLPFLLTGDSLLIFNDTKVVYARLFFKKVTGSVIEIFCLEPFAPNDFQLSFIQTKKVTWKCLIGNNRKWKDGILSQTKEIDNQRVTLTASRKQSINESWIVEFSWNKDLSFAEIMHHFGVIPLPPYLNREAQEQDQIDYQTIYAQFEGSVAAPTAGLHFTDKTFNDLQAKKVKTDFVTLHVGAGTFKPVTTHTIGQHEMHTEKVFVSIAVVRDLLSYIDKDIICVGTTSVRTIESLYWYGVMLIEQKGLWNETDNSILSFNIHQWYPYISRQDISAAMSLKTILQYMERKRLDYISGQTQLIIVPSYSYRIVKGMITNFHQPRSTLLLLVGAMIGEQWKRVYQHALEKNYRFLSYGDACLFRCSK